MVKKHIEHGFTWFRILCLILAIGLVIALRWGFILVPQVRQTANQVANLNDLKKVDFRCEFHLIAGWLKCSGTI